MKRLRAGVHIKQSCAENSYARCVSSPLLVLVFIFCAATHLGDFQLARGKGAGAFHPTPLSTPSPPLPRLPSTWFGACLNRKLTQTRNTTATATRTQKKKTTKKQKKNSGSAFAIKILRRFFVVLYN